MQQVLCNDGWVQWCVLAVCLASLERVAAVHGVTGVVHVFMCAAVLLPSILCAVESFEGTDKQYLEHNDNISRDDG